MRIEVADSGPGEGAGLATAQSTGVGLANIRDRLAQAYGAGPWLFDAERTNRGGSALSSKFRYETGRKDYS